MVTGRGSTYNHSSNCFQLQMTVDMAEVVYADAYPLLGTCMYTMCHCTRPCMSAKYSHQTSWLCSAQPEFGVHHYHSVDKKLYK